MRSNSFTTETCSSPSVRCDDAEKVLDRHRAPPAAARHQAQRSLRTAGGRAAQSRSRRRIRMRGRDLKVEWANSDQSLSLCFLSRLGNILLTLLIIETSGRPMSAGEELNELKERAEKATERKGLAPVSLTMAVVAVLVATISLLGHRAHTEEILLQNKTTDQWAYYQAKNLRLQQPSGAERRPGRARRQERKGRTGTEALRSRHREVPRGKEGDPEGSSRPGGRTASRDPARQPLRSGEVFLEIALVVTSITLLTGRKHYWMLGMVLAAAGIVTRVHGVASALSALRFPAFGSHQRHEAAQHVAMR